ncbi:hypothetical protein F4776DRAFT_637029, partial [Hypoxylon sp. NC0597]
MSNDQTDASPIAGQKDATSSNALETPPFYLCSICHDDEDRSLPVTLPCGHLFHVDCIVLWLDTSGGAPRCPYCRRDVTYPVCGHRIERELFQPGADLRTNTPNNHTCDYSLRIDNIEGLVPIINKILFVLQVAYPERINQTPSSVGPSTSSQTLIYSMRREFHSTCIQLRNLFSKSTRIYIEQWREIGNNYTDHEYDADTYGSWQNIPREIWFQLFEMFPGPLDWFYNDFADDGSTQRRIRFDMDGPSLPSWRLVALNVRLQQLLRGLNRDGASGNDQHPILAVNTPTNSMV